VKEQEIAFVITIEISLHAQKGILIIPVTTSTIEPMLVRLVIVRTSAEITQIVIGSLSRKAQMNVG